MLTKFEAIERANAIWGDYTIKQRGSDTFLLFRDGSMAHRLDANGHPSCHKECKRLETKAYERKALV